MCLMACGLLGCFGRCAICCPKAAAGPGSPQQSRQARDACPAASAACRRTGQRACRRMRSARRSFRSAQPLTGPPPRPAFPQWLFKCTARHVSGCFDQGALAEGDVELRRQGMVLKADRILFDASTRWAKAQGGVTFRPRRQPRHGAQRRASCRPFGRHLRATMPIFPRANAGGEAKRLLFLGADHLRAERATYSSCPKDDKGEQDWVFVGRPARHPAGQGRRPCLRRRAALQGAHPGLAQHELPGQW